MSKMKQEDVERIATEYVESIGVRPCLLVGSEFYGEDDPPSWRVFFRFCESPTDEIGLPHSLVIDVNDLTGEASSIASL